MQLCGETADSSLCAFLGIWAWYLHFLYLFVLFIWGKGLFFNIRKSIMPMHPGIQVSCKCHITCFKKKGPGFCNICLHIDKKFTSRMWIAFLPNPHMDIPVRLRAPWSKGSCARARKIVHPRILNKDGEIHGTPWFAVAESPSKNTNVRGFSLSRRVFLDRCAPVSPQSLPVIFHRSRVTLVRKQREMCFTVLKTPPATLFSHDSFSQLLSR